MAEREAAIADAELQVQRARDTVAVATSELSAASEADKYAAATALDEARHELEAASAPINAPI